MKTRSRNLGWYGLVCSLLLILLTLPMFVSAQTDPALEAGLKPFGTYEASGIDFVNTTTGKLHVHIPLLSYPQRGGRLHANYFVIFDSASYNYSCPPPPGECFNAQILNRFWENAGAWVQTDAVPGDAGTDIFNDPPYDQQYVGTLLSVVDPDGATHRMGAIPASGPTTQMRALDASGYYMDTTNWSSPTIYDSSGNSYNTSTTVMADAIGNHMTVPPYSGAITSDTIGRSIPAPPRTGATCPSWTSWQVPGNAQNGGTVTYQLCFTQVGGHTLLSQIKLPNDTYYTFSYQAVEVNNIPGYIVDLTEITLPTGGSISYTWTSEGSECGTSNSWRRVVTRTVNDGNGNQWVWHYARSGSGYTTTLTITDPLGNVAIHTGTELNNQPCSLYETQYQQQDNAGHTLRTLNTAYTWSSDPGGRDYTTYDILAAAPVSAETTLDNGAQSWTTKSYPPNTFTFCDLGQKPGGGYNSCTPSEGGEGTAIYIGNPSTVCANDYGTGSSCSNATQETSNSYLAFQNSNYLSSNQLTLKSQVQITSPVGLGNSSTTNYYYDSGAGSGPGLLTKIDKGLGAIYQKTYTGYGMLYQDIDPLGNTTKYAYDGTGLYLRSETNALSQVTQYSYDSNTGILLSTEDPNSQTTSYQYDELNRPTSVSYPDGGYTQYTYDDTFPDSVTVTDKITDSVSKQEVAWVDGLGRVTLTELASDPDGSDYACTTYDGLGRRASVTNPYRGSQCPSNPTQYSYDALNRLVTETEPDNSVVHYLYSGNQMTVTDEAGNERETQTNALGWLTNVWEAPNVNGYDYETTYGYDGLGNLKSVSENGSRARSFGYDSLSRLMSANNPETGTISYYYDTTSTLTSKTDGLGTITYTPDALHRIISKSYSDSEPTIYYCYDGNQTACGAPAVTNGNGIGRRTGMGDASGNTAWWYDPMGRVAEVSKTIANYATGNTYYTYNLDGSLGLIEYPSEDEVQYTVGGAGRVTDAGWDGISEGWPLATNITYTPDGQMAQYTNGDGETVTKTYNSRLQINSEQVSGSAGTILNWTYNFNSGHDNGNIIAFTNNLDTTRSQAFTYDPLNRISTASFYGGSDQYGYDAWANLLSKTVTSGTGETLSVQVDGNNHLVGYGYDAAGNLTTVNGVQYNTFNLENQWVSQSAYHATFLYDGDGQRVKRFEVGVNPETTYFWNDESGNVLMESDSELNINNLYFYLNGERIAYGPLLGDDGLYFYYGDHNGNVRMITDDFGTVCYDADYYPWGGVIPNPMLPNSCPTQYYQFAGKDRDPAMGVDYFGARFYQDTMGRFYSADWAASPEPVPYAKMGNPQSLNLYTYTVDNPISYRDLDGHLFNTQDQPGAGGCQQYSADNGNCGTVDGEAPGPEEQDQRVQIAQESSGAQQQNTDQSLTNVVYNETGSGRADANAKPGAAGSAEDLANGRQAVAEIANRVINAGHPDRVAPSDLTNKAADAVKKDPNAIDAYSKSRTAADAALKGSNISNGATQYRTRVGSDVTTPVGKSRTNPGTSVSQHYGPFIEGNHTFVIVVAQ